MGNKHVYYDMIEAKAADMSLVVFSKRNDSNRWVELEIHKQCISFNEIHSYFLCLPKHNEQGQCLHWLNGGDVQDFFDGEWSDCAPLSKTINTDSENSLKFSINHMFMNEEFHFRIKPKTEKRYVVIHEGKLVHELFKCDTDIRMTYLSEYSRLQIFPIELEV